jgi:hypothetical protein
LKFQSIKLPRLNRIHMSLICAAFLLVAPAGALATKDGLTGLRSKAASLLKGPAAVTGQSAPVNPIFAVRSYGGKCMEYGRALTPDDPPLIGSPVFINQCNVAVAQQIRVEELTDRPGHLVILRAGDKVIGAKTGPIASQAMSPAAPGDIGIADQTPLETQGFNNSPGQIFALDGDSIILAANRKLVVEVENNRGKNLTPLVLGQRDLDDSEFWDFIALGSSLRPTSGFMSVSTKEKLKDLLPEIQPEPGTPGAAAQAKPGTVIEVNASIELTGTILVIPAEVTIRGDRRGARPRYELYSADVPGYSMVVINGNHVRITGLRLRGPSRDLYPNTDGKGIQAPQAFTSIIDHNDLLDWPVSAISVTGLFSDPGSDDPRDPRTIPRNVRIARNFIHHNRRAGLGYGVDAGNYGGDPLIEGNTFLENRHAIAGDGTRNTGYRAWFNLVMHDAPDYGNGIQQDFDMHGTGNDPCQHCGGIAGRYIDIAWNTFLGGDRENFLLRGTPTFLAEFHNNVCVGSQSTVIRNVVGALNLYVWGPPQFNVSNPTSRLGMGDFDGDGAQDLFLATGAAWYYSLSGQTEWRFINAQPEKIRDLLFGDIDADGRADVFTLRESAWFVSWGGASKWEKIADATEPVSSRRFLDKSYNGGNGPSDGSFYRPYTSFAEAVSKTPSGGTIWLLRTQTIPAAGTYNKRITIKAAPGVNATLGG